MQNPSWPGQMRDHIVRNKSLLQVALLTVPLVIFAVLAWQNRWIADDGFIFLRIVDQITSGNGPVFNIGERVEAFSSVIWVALLAAADLVIPLRLEWIAVLLGIGLCIFGLLMAILGAGKLVRLYQPRALLVPFGILVPVSTLAVWRFASSGMETGLVVGWLGACLLVLGSWASRETRLTAASAVLLGLGWLIRPELALFSALFIATVLLAQWREDHWQGRLGTLVAAGLLPVLYQIFRMGYYGSLVPNPALAKDADQRYWNDGWLYLLDFANPYWLWLALAIILVGGYLPMLISLWRHQASRALLVVTVFLVCGLLHAIYIINVGGDWLHARLLIPAVYTLIMPVAVVPMTKAHAAAALLIPWALACALFLRPPQAGDPRIFDRFVLPMHSHVLPESRGWREDSGIMRRLNNERGFHADAGLGMRFVRIEPVQPGPFVRVPGIAARALGLQGYSLGPDWYLLDTFGLAHPLVARFETTPTLHWQPRRPGHKKPLPTVWLAAMVSPVDSRPRQENFPSVFNPLIPHVEDDQFQVQINYARVVLNAPEIKELYTAITEPLDLQRFIKNLTGAYARTKLTIPPDPQQAHEKFCSEPGRCNDLWWHPDSGG